MNIRVTVITQDVETEVTMSNPTKVLRLYSGLSQVEVGQVRLGLLGTKLDEFLHLFY